jgi:signal transduction histidine kinase
VNECLKKGVNKVYSEIEENVNQVDSVPTLNVIFEMVILLTSVCGLMAGCWLYWRAAGKRDLTALSAFAIMMALWCFGHLAIAHDMQALGIFLILANPLMPTFFLDFSVRFVSNSQIQGEYSHRLKPWLAFLSQHLNKIYALSLLICALSWWLNGAIVIEKAGLFLFVFTDYGWFNLIYTVLLGILGHAVLLYGWFIHKGNKRRSILVLFMVSAWGLLLATSFIFPSVGVDAFPYPMMLLPTYILLLVYAVVRYQILAVNAFANRALLWLAMMLSLLVLIAFISAMSAPLGMQALAQVPAWQLWLYSLTVLILSALIYPPLSRLIERLIYPGSRLNEGLLDTWTQALKEARDWPQLISIAESLLHHQLGQIVTVSIELDEVQAKVNTGMHETRMQLLVRHSHQGWQFELLAWQDVSPGMRLSGEVFASLFSTRCGLLQQSLELAEAERQRLDEQHLVELGGLSAAMAHELRNPLNIISMASMSTDDVIKQHIQTQVQRADRLISDLLLYSGSLKLDYTSVPLKPLLLSLQHQTELTNVAVTLDMADDIELLVDAQRMQQVFINLMDNAAAFLRNQTHAALKIEAKVYVPSNLVQIRLHNNGPKMSEAMDTESLFQPFVSKRSGGHGLGLAIVKRIIDAHQGRIRFRDDLSWPVSFEIELPLNIQETKSDMSKHRFMPHR